MIDKTTVLMWWRYLDSVAHKLVADYEGRLTEDRRYPCNPRHTADCLKGEAMLCAAEVDERCRSFAMTRGWPDDLTGDEFTNIQHRLGCAKLALHFMMLYPGHETAIALQSGIPDPRNERHFIECLLIPVWRLLGDIFLEDQAEQLQQLLSAGELENLLATNPPLQG